MLKHSSTRTRDRSRHDSGWRNLEQVRGATIQIKVGGRRAPPLTGGKGGKTGIRRSFQFFKERFRPREMAISTCATGGCGRSLANSFEA